MLEQLTALQQAMEEGKGKAFVYERFQDYFFWYESLIFRGVDEKIRFREAEEKYLEYMNKVQEVAR